MWISKWKWQLNRLYKHYRYTVDMTLPTAVNHLLKYQKIMYRHCRWEFKVFARASFKCSCVSLAWKIVATINDINASIDDLPAAPCDLTIHFVGFFFDVPARPYCEPMDACEKTIVRCKWCKQTRRWKILVVLFQVMAAASEWCLAYPPMTEFRCNSTMLQHV